jgi:2-keto-4-pentenoate hydratase/2-oxohepta-3-ene-1,7-dioic acid hydratase in catechol pathway
MTYRLATIDAQPALVDAEGGWHSLVGVGGDLAHLSVNELLARSAELHAVSAALVPARADGRFDEALDAGRVGPPVPQPRAVFGVGLNYSTHAAESGMELPSTPLVFNKFPTCIVGPRADVALNCDAGDYEVELVVAIGTGGRDIAPGDAWVHVAGVTIGQDISDRALQFATKPPQFDLGKSRDTFGPIGPVLVSVDCLPDRSDLALTCAINGEQRQSDRTSHMIFDVPALVSYLSRILTLRPGDLIFTGTPEGVGATTRSFLVPGDVITSTIEGIGTLVNRCVER